MRENVTDVIAWGLACLTAVVIVTIIAACTVLTPSNPQGDAIEACHYQAKEHGWAQNDLTACLDHAAQFSAKDK